MQLRINDLLEKANYELDKGFPIPGFVLLKRAKMEALLDRINASIPEDIKEAEMILRRHDEILNEARNKADKTLADAQSEAARVLSESELLRAVQSEAQKIREQVIEDCESIKRKALDDADNVRIKAADEYMKIRDGAESYAEQVLSNIDTDLQQLQQIVKNAQAHLDKMKAESYTTMANLRSNTSGYQNQQQLEEICPEE